MSAREVRLSPAAWLVLFGVLALAGCGGGGCDQECERAGGVPGMMTTPPMPCAASGVCLK